MEALKDTLKQPIIIAGPCAAESREQVIQSALEAKARGIEIVRASLWKPRTKPGWDGAGKAGLPWLAEVAEMGLIPATEVMNVEQAKMVIKEVTQGRVMVWLGSRNQNHPFQQKVGSVVGKDPERIILGIKNQPWPDLAHWEGIIDHVRKGWKKDRGAFVEQIVLIHRGFMLGDKSFRNSPNFEMAKQLKEKLQMPMIIDPSHIGGTVELVDKVTEMALNFSTGSVRFDGFMYEVHNNPQIALTDAKQQLPWDRFDKVMEKVRSRFAA